MFFKKRKTRWSKWILARYIVWIEVIGFAFVGVLIAGMIGSAIFKIDDSMKFSNVSVEPRREPITLPAEAYVNSVEVKDGDAVEADQTAMTITSTPEDLALLKALDSTQKALEALRGRPAGSESPAGVEKSLTEALELGKAALKGATPKPVKVSLAGIVTSGNKEPIQNLKGRVVSGQVGEVYTYSSLRFPVPVGGENAGRVRVNLLAEEDITNWKRLTAVIKAPQAPEDKVLQELWTRMKGKLEEVKPGKTPLKRLMPEIVGALNDVLRAKDFYTTATWSGKTIPPEAQQLIAQGVAQLKPDELIRLNRLLLQVAMPGAIASSLNEHQPVKAKLYIQVERKTPEGKTIKEKPKIFPVQGRVVHEPLNGQVIIDLPNPRAEVVEYMKSRKEKPELAAVTASGTVVVGRISLFNFLFR